MDPAQKQNPQASNSPEPATPPTPQATIQDAVQSNYKRPVSAWPPRSANQQMQPPAATPQPEKLSEAKEAAILGTEVIEAAEKDPKLNQSLAPTASAATNTVPMSSTSAPTPPQQSQETLPTEPAPNTEDGISDSEAKELFKEEPSTKKHFKKMRIKKFFKRLILLILFLLILAGGYIFFAGNQAASSYKKSSSINTYKEAFTKLNDSINQEPINSSDIEAGFNQLQVANSNSSSLSTVFLGQLNPNYKKAQQLKGLQSSYQQEVKAYQDKFAAYPQFISSLSEADQALKEISELSNLDYKNETAESLTNKFKAITESCKEEVDLLTNSTKPSDLSVASEKLVKIIKGACLEGPDSLSGGALTSLNNQTGVTTPELQAKLKSQIDPVVAKVNQVLNGSGPDAFQLNSLIAYVRDFKDQTKKLQEEAGAILT